MAFNEQFNTLMAALAEVKRALEEEKAVWANFGPKLDTSNLADPITLNVGSTHFALTLKDLTSKPGSYFAAMFSGRWDAKVDKNGAFFINRSPVVFQYVADHLRGEELRVGFLSPAERELLITDADFYRLDELGATLAGPVVPPILHSENPNIVGELKFRPGITPNVKFSDGYRKGTKRGGNHGWNCTMVGPEVAWPDSGFSEVHVRLTTPKKHGNDSVGIATMVGLARSQDITVAAMAGVAPGTMATMGWYLQAGNGDIFGETLPTRTPPTRSNYRYCIAPTGKTVIIGVRLHSDGCVSFAVNGTDHGTAFTIPKGEQYRVAIMPYSRNITVELLVVDAKYPIKYARRLTHWFR